MMKKPIQISIAVLILFIIPQLTYSQAGDIVVIVNNDNPTTAMTASSVKLTYLRKIKKRWTDLNKNIVPVDSKGNSGIREKFLKDVLQMSSDEVTRYFTEREYQNAEAPPMRFGTDSEIVSFVETNLGAIGFVSKSSVKAGSKVKIVLAL